MTDASRESTLLPVARTLCWGTHEEAARLGVEWLYQIHAAGRVVHDSAEDLTLARAWAALYGNGPRETLVKQWLAVLEREPR